MKEATRVFQTSKENLWSGDDNLIYWTAAEQQTVRSLEAGSEHDRQPTGKISYSSVKWTGWSSWLYRISSICWSQISGLSELSFVLRSHITWQCPVLSTGVMTVHDCMTLYMTSAWRVHDTRSPGMVAAIVSGLPTHSVAQQSPRPDQRSHDQWTALLAEVSTKFREILLGRNVTRAFSS